MKAMQRLMIFFLLIVLRDAALFGAIKRIQTPAASSQSRSAESKKRIESKKVAPSSAVVSDGVVSKDVVSAVAILNNYHQKRAAFLEELRIAGKAYDIVSAKAQDSDEMEKLADKFQPILANDLPFLDYVVTDEKVLEPAVVKSVRESFRKSVEDMLTKKWMPDLTRLQNRSTDEKDMVEKARAYLELGNYAADIESTLKTILASKITNQKSVDEYVQKLLEKITSQEKVIQLSEQDKNELKQHAVEDIELINDNWDTENGRPRDDYMQRVSHAIQMVNDNVSSQLAQELVAQVRKKLTTVYGGIYQNDRKKAKDAVEGSMKTFLEGLPNIPEKSASKGWWHFW